MDRLINISATLIIVLGLAVSSLMIYVQLNTFHDAPDQPCEMAMIVDHFPVKSCGTLLQQRGY